MKYIKDFFLGKEITETVDLQAAIATITMLDGTTHFITRDGYIDNSSMGILVYTGNEMLKDYLTTDDRLIFTDKGKPIVFSQIKNIDIHTTSKFETITYRK